MNAAEFLEQAEPLLLANEARHNLLLGIAGNVRDLPHLFAPAHFWLVDGAAAMPTPPWNVVVAKPRDRSALAALVDRIDVDLDNITEVSRRQLARGRFSFLYTDATNATAERIYARLGYTRVCESRQFAFT